MTIKGADMLAEGIREAKAAMAYVHQYRGVVISALGRDLEAVKYAEGAFNRLHSARAALQEIQGEEGSGGSPDG